MLLKLTMMMIVYNCEDIKSLISILYYVLIHELYLNKKARVIFNAMKPAVLTGIQLIFQINVYRIAGRL